jgi:hypothetical protein
MKKNKQNTLYSLFISLSLVTDKDELLVKKVYQ